MDSYVVLIILSSLVIFSYIFDLIARRTKFPSVPLLLLTGIVIRIAVDYLKVPTINFFTILPTLGAVGLVLIVLEGALELKFERKKIKLILTSFFSALVILAATSIAITYTFISLTGYPFFTCLINSLPYSIISSAIAIPSSRNLSAIQKEFVVYESTFSDIIGVAIFNFMLFNQDLQVSSIFALTFETLLILAVSFVFCLILLYIIQKIKHQVKFFLVLSIIILVYSAGHLFHLPSLILVLAFGLFLNNTEGIRSSIFNKYFMYDDFQHDLSLFYKLSAESAFLIRTFFFIIFGFIITLSDFNNWNLMNYSIIILMIIYIIRVVYLRFFGRVKLMPLAVLNPRGLISILLLLSLPPDLMIPGIDTTLLFLLVMSTSLIMSIGLISTGKASMVDI